MAAAEEVITQVDRLFPPNRVEGNLHCELRLSLGLELSGVLYCPKLLTIPVQPEEKDAIPDQKAEAHRLLYHSA